MIQIVHLPPVRNVHRVDGVAVVSLTAYVDVYLIITVESCGRSMVAPPRQQHTACATNTVHKASVLLAAAAAMQQAKADSVRGTV